MLVDFSPLTDEQLSDFLSRAAVQLDGVLTQQLFSVVQELIARRAHDVEVIGVDEK